MYFLMLVLTAVPVLYSLCETLLAVYSLLFIEVHVQVFEVLLLFPTKLSDDEPLPTSDIYFKKKKASSSLSALLKFKCFFTSSAKAF